MKKVGISQRAYARHRGVSHTAVQVAIRSGRITPEPDGSIDPVKADEQWARTTDPAQQRGAASRAQTAESVREALAAPKYKPMPPAAAQAVNEAAEEAAEQFGTMPSYRRARAVNEAIKAQRAKLMLERLKVELVDRRAAERHANELLHHFRASWSQLPARVAPLLAAEFRVDVVALEALLGRVIEGHLEELGETDFTLEALLGEGKIE